MNSFYAICPSCKKSINARENLLGGYMCPLCGEIFSYEYLYINDLIVDYEECESEYDKGQEQFINNFFLDASEHFLRVILANPNHYLAEYYYQLCIIYENESRDDFDLPKHIMIAVKSSLIKMERAQVKVSDKIAFVSMFLSQAVIILTAYLQKNIDLFEGSYNWSALRQKCCDFIEELSQFIALDTESLMVYNTAISKSVIQIAELGIRACQKIVVARIKDSEVDYPTLTQYDMAKRLYNSFSYYINQFDSGYVFYPTTDEYNKILLYSENAISHINKYNDINKANRKKHLSTFCEELLTMRVKILDAFELSHYACFVGQLSINPADKMRRAVVEESLKMFLEYASPRYMINQNKKVEIVFLQHSELLENGKRLDDFATELNQVNKALSQDIFDEFYTNVFDTVKLYHTLVNNSFNRVINKLKEAQSADFRYYMSFVYHMASICSLSFGEFVPFEVYRSNERHKLLKMCKEMCEEYFFLSDYRIEEIETKTKHKDILRIYDLIENNITKYQEK